ncbi:hypothetical protein [Candidatus Bealeia paramacronuclearis]|uniref:hypothetical protein n=1 Tax=Candidatus Bealeia paramacronuclearis TaxID=1921001 RepID=UPI002F2689BC
MANPNLSALIYSKNVAENRPTLVLPLRRWDLTLLRQRADYLGDNFTLSQGTLKTIGDDYSMSKRSGRYSQIWAAFCGKPGILQIQNVESTSFGLR